MSHNGVDYDGSTGRGSSIELPRGPAAPQARKFWILASENDDFQWRRENRAGNHDSEDLYFQNFRRWRGGRDPHSRH